ncbi:MAG TPA: hypothetical protein VI076_11995 [Actinopolymorphaceae bacterium]
MSLLLPGRAMALLPGVTSDKQVSRPAVAEHLQILRRARLFRDEPVGRQRFCHLEAAPPQEVSGWLHPFERFWRERLREMATLLRDEPEEQEQEEKGESI